MDIHYLWDMLQRLAIPCGPDRVINPPTAYDSQIELTLNNAFRLVSTPKDHIEKYIPKQQGINSRRVYVVLIMISGLPTTTKHHIIDGAGMSPRTVNVSVEQLLLLKYIKPVKRTRLIIPFGKYKQDTGYVLTVKGKTVVKQLLDY